MIDTSYLNNLPISEAMAELNSGLPISMLLVITFSLGLQYLLHLFDKNFGLTLASLKKGRGRLIVLVDVVILLALALFILIKGMSYLYLLYIVGVLLVTFQFVLNDYTFQYPVQVPNIIGMVSVYLLTLFITTYHYYDMVNQGIEVVSYPVDYNLFKIIGYAFVGSIILNIIYKLFGTSKNPVYYNAFKSNQLLSYGYLVSLYMVVLCLAPESRVKAYIVLGVMAILFTVLAMINFFSNMYFFKLCKSEDLYSIQRILNPFSFGKHFTALSTKHLLFAVTPVVVYSLLLVSMAYFGGII